MNTAQIVQRLDVTGIILLLLGAAAGFFGHKIISRFFPGQDEKAAVIARFAGLAVAVLGALILLEVFQ